MIRYQNTEPPIFRLPIEVLQDIFIRCVTDYYVKHSNSRYHRWVYVSYVCRRWRNVALAYPTLWTCVYITSRRWTEEFLTRSEQAPLKIRANLPEVSKSKLLVSLEKALNHLDRIEKLELVLDRSFVSKVFRKLSSPAPRLQDLFITVVPALPLEWRPLLFEGDTPVLRSLKFLACPVLLHMHKLASLTVLRLASIPADFRPSMEEFLPMLNSLRGLEHISLYDALANATGFLSSPAFKMFEKIDLPHLSHFAIDAPLSTVAAIFSLVNIPLNANVLLENNSSENPWIDDDVTSFLRSLLEQRYRALSTPIRSMFISSIRARVFLTCSLHPRECTPGPYKFFPKEDRRFFFELNFDTEDVGAEPFISDICRTLPLATVWDLSTIHPPFSAAFWQQMLQRLQEVRHIYLNSGGMPDLSVLSPTTHLATHENAQDQELLTVDDQGPCQLLAPHLESLELYAIHFSTEGNLLSSAITRDCLFDALSKRRGFPGRLTMGQCRVGDETVDLEMLWGDGDVEVVSETRNVFRF